MKKIISFSLLFMIGSTALTGCQVSLNPSYPSSTTQITESQSINESKKYGISHLAQRVSSLLSNSSFRDALTEFIISGKKPKGYDQEFEELVSLVSKDKIWYEEKGKLLSSNKKPASLKKESEISLYIDALTVSYSLLPQKADSLGLSTKYNFDVDALRSNQEDASYWSKKGGVQIIDNENKIYDVYTPIKKGAFISSDNLLSAEGAVAAHQEMASSEEMEDALSSILSDVTQWVSLNGEKIPKEASLEPFTPEILGNIQIPVILISDGQAEITVKGTKSNYSIIIHSSDGKEYCIDNSGRVIFPENKASESETFLPPTRALQGFDEYRKVVEREFQNSNETNLPEIVNKLEDEQVIDGAHWRIGNKLTDYFAILEFSNQEKYEYGDLTKILSPF